MHVLLPLLLAVLVASDAALGQFGPGGLNALGLGGGRPCSTFRGRRYYYVVNGTDADCLAALPEAFTVGKPTDDLCQVDGEVGVACIRLKRLIRRLVLFFAGRAPHLRAEELEEEAAAWRRDGGRGWLHGGRPGQRVRLVSAAQHEGNDEGGHDAAAGQEMRASAM